jgi:hypothetical protein
MIDGATDAPLLRERPRRNHRWMDFSEYCRGNRNRTRVGDQVFMSMHENLIVPLLLDDHQDVPDLIRLPDLGLNFFDRAALSRNHR